MSNLIMEIKVCSIENCSNKMKAKGLCKKHYSLYYFKSEKGKEARKKYAMSEKCKEANKRYAKSEKGREANCERVKKYSKTEKGKEAQRKTYHKRRALKYTSQVENFTNLEIFERDNWTCGLCGEAIDKTLNHPHPLSKSLDHIIPISKGGNHSRENVQAAHLICNIRKGNRAD